MGEGLMHAFSQRSCCSSKTLMWKSIYYSFHFIYVYMRGNLHSSSRVLLCDALIEMQNKIPPYDALSFWRTIKRVISHCSHFSNNWNNAQLHRSPRQSLVSNFLAVALFANEKWLHIIYERYKLWIKRSLNCLIYCFLVFIFNRNR